MRVTGHVRFLPVAVVLLAIGLARGLDSSRTGQWSASDPSYVPFPVYSIAVSADNRFVGLGVGKSSTDASAANLARGRAFYILDLQTGYHINVGLGELGLEAGPSGHRFLLFELVGSDGTVSLYDGVQKVRVFNVGQAQHLWWNPYSGNSMFPAHWDVNRDGFDVVGILDVSSGGITRLPLRQTTEVVWICAKTGHFYTQNWDPNLKPVDSDFGLDEYDSEGKYIRSIKSALADYSAHCRFVLPGNGGHGPSPWGIFDAKTGERLLDYPWNDSDDSPLTIPEAWNPRYDHLLLISTYPAKGGRGTLGILDVNSRKTVVNWSCPPGAPPRVWSGDGKSTVTFRDHHIAFEPLDPKILGTTSRDNPR